MTIRNDDPAYDTDVNNYRRFCEIVDEFQIPIIQAIVPIGRTIIINSEWSNPAIMARSGNDLLVENEELYEFMISRRNIDEVGLHGLWHLHEPTDKQIMTGKGILNGWGLHPTWFVTPFNEGEYGSSVCGLKVSAKTDCLETFLYRGEPKTPIVYLHSWRFGENSYSKYSYQDLENCLRRLMKGDI